MQWLAIIRVYYIILKVEGRLDTRLLAIRAMSRKAGQRISPQKQSCKSAFLRRSPICPSPVVVPDIANVCFTNWVLRSSTIGLSDNVWRKSQNVSEFENGICKNQWPSPCQYKTPTILWASSLLKWKGLDILIDALSKMSVENRPNTHICFIKPLDTLLPISNNLMKIENVKWHEEPDNLDRIRASCNIFISTSQNEPFGLSILEAMASGHCVMIPADNAYWDKTLIHNKNCIKYAPQDPDDLRSKIQFLQDNPDIIKRIGACSQSVSLKYKAEDLHQPIISAISKLHFTAQEST